MTYEDRDHQTIGEALARIDERTENMERRLGGICKKLDRNYVTKDQFDPVKKIVYGLVGSVLLGFLAGVAVLVFR